MRRFYPELVLNSQTLDIWTNKVVWQDFTFLKLNRLLDRRLLALMRRCCAYSLQLLYLECTDFRYHRDLHY